jgi:two-component system, NarL family, sensor histidine kinase UhpB
MDLRRRLVGYLGGLLLALLLVTLLINLSSLRADVRTELAASGQLARVLLESGRDEPALPPAEAAARLEAVLRGGPLRHIRIDVDGAPAPRRDGGLSAGVAALLGFQADPGQPIRIGQRSLRIASDPTSEIEERLGDTVRLLITLLLFSGATLLVVWWSADRALAPVRALEAGLQRLARGEPDAALPGFALREFARVAGAIDALAAALSSARQAQRQLSHRLIQMQEEERGALAMELHDEMGQTLTAISVTAAYLERHAERLDAARIAECARDLRRDARGGGEQLRAMLKRLRPHCLDGPGLAGALRELVAGWRQRAADIAFTLELPATLPPLDKDAGLALYRVVQEGLTNVVRHSAARHCGVHIEADAGLLRLCIEDDGRGAPAGGAARGCGLLGMEERLRMVGGRLDVGAAPAGGMRLLIGMPITEIETERETT